MNATQITALTIAGCAVVLATCYWLALRTAEPEGEVLAEQDAKHFDSIDEQWKIALDKVKDGTVELANADAHYRFVHKQLDTYIYYAELVDEKQREKLNAKNAQYLSDQM